MDFDKVLREISDSADSGMADGDYFKDRLLYCGKCHKPKQHVLKNGMTVNCICECGIRAREKREADRIEQSRRIRIDELRKAGFPDAETRSWTFDADDGTNTELTRMAKRYVEHFDEMKKAGKGILFYGKVGTGKTFVSACIANALTDKGYPCLVTNFVRIVNTVQGMHEGRQAYFDSLNRFDLLVIDDLSAERDTEYMSETVQNVIDSRYRSGLPLIVTTNLSANELMHPADIRKHRMYSRLLDMCLLYEVKGGDRRIRRMASDKSKMKEILGL